MSILLVSMSTVTYHLQILCILTLNHQVNRLYKLGITKDLKQPCGTPARILIHFDVGPLASLDQPKTSFVIFLSKVAIRECCYCWKVIYLGKLDHLAVKRVSQ